MQRQQQQQQEHVKKGDKRNLRMEPFIFPCSPNPQNTSIETPVSTKWNYIFKCSIPNANSFLNKYFHFFFDFFFMWVLLYFYNKYTPMNAIVCQQHCLFRSLPARFTECREFKPNKKKREKEKRKPTAPLKMKMRKISHVIITYVYKCLMFASEMWQRPCILFIQKKKNVHIPGHPPPAIRAVFRTANQTKYVRLCI